MTDEKKRRFAAKKTLCMLLIWKVFEQFCNMGVFLHCNSNILQQHQIFPKEFLLVINKYDTFITRDLKDKTMDDKLLHIPNDDKQNYLAVNLKISIIGWKYCLFLVLGTSLIYSPMSPPSLLICQFSSKKFLNPVMRVRLPPPRNQPPTLWQVQNQSWKQTRMTNNVKQKGMSK